MKLIGFLKFLFRFYERIVREEELWIILTKLRVALMSVLIKNKLIDTTLAFVNHKDIQNLHFYRQSDID